MGWIETAREVLFPGCGTLEIVGSIIALTGFAFLLFVVPWIDGSIQTKEHSRLKALQDKRQETWMVAGRKEE